MSILATIRDIFPDITGDRYIFFLERMCAMEDWLDSLTPSISEDALIVKHCLLARSVQDWLSAIRIQIRSSIHIFDDVQRLIDADFDMNRVHTVDVMLSLMSQKNRITAWLYALLDDLEFEAHRFNQLERDVQEYYQW